jgi:hypothetical protein
MSVQYWQGDDYAGKDWSRPPEGYRKSHGEYRHLVLRRFPFGVFYLFDAETISLVAVP